MAIPSSLIRFAHATLFGAQSGPALVRVAVREALRGRVHVPRSGGAGHDEHGKHGDAARDGESDLRIAGQEGSE